MPPTDAIARPPSVASRRRRRVAFAAAALIGTVASAYAFWLRPTWDRAEALELARAGEFDAARPRLIRILERHPSDSEVLETLARGCLKSGDEPQAAEYLDRWIEAQPRNPEPLRMRMELGTKRRQYDSAFADGLRLRELRPDDDKLQRQVLGIAVAAGLFEEAERICRECLRAEPNDAALRIRLAGIRSSRGDAGGAVALLEALLMEKPGHTGAMQALAMQFNELGRPEKAIPLLRAIVDTDPTRQRTAGYQLSLSLERVGRSEEAKKVLAEVRRRQDVEVFRDAIQSQPDNLELRVRLAESLILDGHANDGLSMLNEVLGRDPRFPPAHRVLAEHYQRSGDPTKAERHRKLAEAP